LIDLITDGLALSNSKAAIRSTIQAIIELRHKIFYETAPLHPKSVNADFPGRFEQRSVADSRSICFGKQFD